MNIHEYQAKALFEKFGIAVPKGTKIECVAHYDNSTENPNNPDATKAVSWGDQTWEEMMIGYVNYTWAEKVTTPQQATAANQIGRFGYGSFFAPPRKVRPDAGANAAARRASAA